MKAADKDCKHVEFFSEAMKTTRQAVAFAINGAYVDAEIVSF